MSWDNLFRENRQPTFEEINGFIANPLWQELNAYLQDTYKVCPKLSYSKCSAQRGWNIKYQKSGKSLCTLYPMPGYFIALVVIGNKEMPDAEVLMGGCSEYIKALFHNTPFSAGGKWLMIHVKDQNILRDVKRLINIRIKPQ